MHSPAKDRNRWASAFDGAALDRLQTAVEAWHGAAALTQLVFRDRFLPASTDNATVNLLRRAASGLVLAVWDYKT